MNLLDKNIFYQISRKKFKSGDINETQVIYYLDKEKALHRYNTMLHNAANAEGVEIELEKFDKNAIAGFSITKGNNSDHTELEQKHFEDDLIQEFRIS